MRMLWSFWQVNLRNMRSKCRCLSLPFWQIGLVWEFCVLCLSLLVHVVLWIYAGIEYRGLVGDQPTDPSWSCRSLLDNCQELQGQKVAGKPLHITLVTWLHLVAFARRCAAAAATLLENLMRGEQIMKPYRSLPIPWKLLRTPTILLVVPFW